MVIQGIRTTIAKQPYVYVIFQGGGPDPLSPPLDPHMIFVNSVDPDKPAGKDKHCFKLYSSKHANNYNINVRLVVRSDYIITLSLEPFDDA